MGLCACSLFPIIEFTDTYALGLGFCGLMLRSLRLCIVHRDVGGYVVTVRDQINPSCTLHSLGMLNCSGKTSSK